MCDKRTVRWTTRPHRLKTNRSITCGVRCRTECRIARAYHLRMMSGMGSARNLNDLQLAVSARPGHTYKNSNVLLARAHINGRLELLTAAWERLLGYERWEFTGKSLRQIMQPGNPVGSVVAAIFDELDLEPLDLNLRCRDGLGKCLRLHRRLDPDERIVYILAEHIPESQPRLFSEREDTVS